MKQRNGFTLVELLTVIAIIVLLVTIFLPSLHNVKRQANSVACRSSLRNDIIFSPIELVLVSPDDISGRPTIASKFLAWGKLLEKPYFNSNDGLYLWICDIRCVSDTCCYGQYWILHTCINPFEDNAKGIFTDTLVNNIDQKESAQ